MMFAGRFYGNSGVVERLDQKLRQQRLPHAMIFSGPDGVGKRTCAMRLAMALNCGAEQEIPCGVCSACRKVAAGTHADVQAVTLQEDASQIKIEQIRDLRSRLDFEPLEGAAKVYIIDPAERMTAAAANGLLKALEEPPPATYFFLITTNALELLITIRSRSQTYHFTPARLDDLRRAGIENELVLRWAQGSVGWAVSADPDALRAIRDDVFMFLETVFGANNDSGSEILAASAELSRSKEDYANRMRVFGVLVADLLFLKQGVDHRIVNVDIRGRLAQLAESVSLERIVLIADCLKSIEKNLKSYVNRQLMTDQLALISNDTVAKY